MVQYLINVTVYQEKIGEGFNFAVFLKFETNFLHPFHLNNH